MKREQRNTMAFSVSGFRIRPLTEDPLRGAYGLAWYERKPRSLSPDEWKNLDAAVRSGIVSSFEYFDWKENVR